MIIGNGRWRAFQPDGRVVAQGASGNAQHEEAHRDDFLACIRDGKRPRCDIAIGHESSVLCHLGNIAWRVGRTVRFDPTTETIANDPDADALRGRTYRKPWALPEIA